MGSEGTLGVFSRITLKLIPMPAAKKAMMAVFDTVSQAARTVSAIIANRIVPVTLEFLASFSLGSGWREAPGLVLLILALAVRPTGVFGKAVIRKV